MTSIPRDVTLEVIQALESLGVDYLLVGSLATSAVGFPRSTVDSDLVVDLRPEHVAPLVSQLEDQFYIDARMIREALERKAMFNVIHLATAFKVDLYVLGPRPFDRTEFARRRPYPLQHGEARQVFMATPEDLVLSKLEWYRLGNQISERQWKDLLGVLKTQGSALDLGYLDHWAQELGLQELWQRARQEGLGPL